MRKLAILALLTVLQAACFHATYTTGLHRATHRAPVGGTSHFFLYGLANDATVDAGRACGPAGPAKVDVYKSFLDGFLGVVTLGIYTPRSYEIWCAAPTVPVPAPVAAPHASPAAP